MQKLERILWIIIISVIVYILIPIFGFIMTDFWSDVYAKLCVLFINIIYSISSGIIITKKDGFKWYYPVIIGILFIPASILIYNASTIYFSVLYIIISLASSLIYNKKQV